MRHRIKKTYSVQKDAAQHTRSMGSSKILTDQHQLNKAQLLRSDKSTYFGKLGKSCFRKMQLACSSARKEGEGPRRMSISGAKVIVGKIIPLGLPVMSALVLLLVLGMMVFPVTGEIEEVYAVEDTTVAEDTGTEAPQNDGMVLRLEFVSPKVEGTIGTNDDGSAPAVIGEPSFGGVKLQATAKGINTSNGWSIYVQTANGSSRNLVNDIDASNMIEPIVLPEGNTDGIVGTAIPQNQWGYAIQKDTPGSEVSYSAMKYRPVAATGQTVPTADDGKQELDGDTFTLAFGANIGEGKLAGHYTTNVLVSLVAEAKALVTYQLIYNGNGNTGGSAPAAQSITTRDDAYTFTVLGNTGNLEKTNAEFLGWADSATATAPDYIAGSTITLNRAEGQDTVAKTVYAVWKQVVYDFGDKVYMQEMTLDYCSSLPDGTSDQLIDGRDNKSYWVTVLADTCWMTQDLDLDLGPNGPELTTNNSNYKGSATSWTGGKNVASSQSGWPTTHGNPTQNINWYERDETHGTEHTSLGNLYSFEAATAGTGHSATSRDSEASGSICPAGWKLPLSGWDVATSTLGSFQSLQGIGMDSSSKANASPYYFQNGGLINGFLVSVTTYGEYWSATSYDAIRAYYLSVGNVFGVNSYSNGRYHGFSVRCVVR